jgi:SSS family solute:Na+ symporter
MNPLILLTLYLCVLFPLAWFGRRCSTGRTPHDFYIAGGRMGFFVLLATLFATQYSGNTFMAFPGKSYRMGYAFLMSIPFMMAIVLCYLFYAPSLRRVALQHRFVTPCDWIHHRYQSLPLTLACAGLMVWALLNFLLAQLMAMGHAVSGITEGQISYTTGVLFLALVVVLYESVGGMRAVAWTDTLQGVIMVVAVLFLGGWLLTGPSDFATLPGRVLAVAPEKVRPPDWKMCVTWASSIFIIGVGGSMYPQAIQRIYSAVSTRTLKRTLAVMVFLPLLTVLFADMMGWMAISEFHLLDRIESDKVMALMLAEIAQRGVLLNFAVLLLLLGALAAIMSTADSVLLSLSSILVQDFYAKTSTRTVPEEALLKYGKITSWLLMAVLLIFALQPKVTLWRLLELKFEILIQVAPAFVLGFYLPRLTAGIALIGIAAGTSIAMIGFVQETKWFGIHPGTIGCLVNLAICGFMSKHCQSAAP